MSEFSDLLVRLGGKPLATKDQAPQPRHSESLDENVAKELLHSLMELAAMEPHPRGFAFEAFLRKLFDVSGMSGRASFRLIGEQIDGSFELDGETYLLEATNLPVNPARGAFPRFQELLVC